MSKKFSIAKEIDLKKLDEQIDLYECLNNEEPYLFMNTDTIKKVREEVLLYSDQFMEMFLNKKYQNEAITKYRECNVFLNENLNFGEIEIR